MPMAYFQGIRVQTPIQIIWIQFKNKLEKGGILEILSIKTENQRSSMRKWFLKDHLQNYDTFSALSLRAGLPEGSFATNPPARHLVTKIVTRIRHKVLNV